MWRNFNEVSSRKVRIVICNDPKKRKFRDPVSRLSGPRGPLFFHLPASKRSPPSIFPTKSNELVRNSFKVRLSVDRSQEEEEHERPSRHTLADRWNLGATRVGSVGPPCWESSDREQARSRVGLHHRFEEAGVGRWGPRPRSGSSSGWPRVERLGEIESRPRLLRLQAIVHLGAENNGRATTKRETKTLLLSAFSISLHFAFTRASSTKSGCRFSPSLPSSPPISSPTLLHLPFSLFLAHTRVTLPHLSSNETRDTERIGGHSRIPIHATRIYCSAPTCC